MTFEIVFVLLFAVATAVAMVARWIKIPYTVALVVAGLLLGAVGRIDAPHLTKSLLYAIFLPGLLFEAAFHLEFRKFWSNKLSVVTLAVPGLLVAIALTAVILTPVAQMLHFEEGFTYTHALVFASLIAATDPIAVVGLFRSLGAPKRLAILVEGESLVNDGTAVVVFTLVLAVAQGSNLTVGGALGQFVWVAGAGAMVGIVLGFTVSWLTHKIEDPMVEITLTTIAAYGSFAVGEHFHVSGVIATVVAGMLCGNYGARTGMSPSTKIAVLSFWEYWAFALNSVVFLLIGLEVRPEMLLHAWQPILVAFLAVLVARAAVVYSASAALRFTKERFSWAWSGVLTWGGLRGSLSMVLVLALPLTFPHRGFLITITFGVVVLSILIQGLTMGPLLRRLGIIKSDAQFHDYELQRGQLRAAQAAVEEIAAMQQDRRVPRRVLELLHTQYDTRVKAAEQEIHDLHLAQDELRERERLAASRHLLLIEKESLIESQRLGIIGREAFDQLLGQVDARLMQIEDATGTALVPPAETGDDPTRQVESDPGVKDDTA